jgi:glycerate kinase
MSIRTILVAMDSFKGCASSMEVSTWVAQGLRMALPKDFQVDVVPVCDGGTGFEAVICESASDAIRRTISTVDAAFNDVPTASYALATDNAGRRVAIVESAKTIGLDRIPNSGNPVSILDRSSFALGQMLLAAAQDGPAEILVGMGDSAVQDCGVGALAALGAEFVLRDDRRVCGRRATPRALQTLKSIDRGRLIALPPIRLACNLSSVLVGSSATVEKYARQKGASNEEIKLLSSWTSNLSNLYSGLADIDVGRHPGSGASGGVGAGLIAAYGAVPEYSFNVLNRWTDIESRIACSSLVVVGEGTLDEGTAKGKAPGAIAMLASALGKPVVAVAGSVARQTYGSISGIGILVVQTLTTPSQIRADYMDRDKAQALLREAGIRLAPIAGGMARSVKTRRRAQKTAVTEVDDAPRFVVACDLWQTLITRHWKHNFVETFSRALAKSGMSAPHSIIGQCLNVSMMRYELDRKDFARRLVDLVASTPDEVPGRLGLISNALGEVACEQANQSEWIIGAPAFLMALRDRGARLVAVSNSTQEVMDVLNNLGVRSYFDEVVLSYEHGYVKPNPALYLRSKWIRRAKEERIPTIVIGDQFAKDILPAQLLGFDGILLQHRKRQAKSVWYPTSPPIAACSTFEAALDLVTQRMGASSHENRSVH